jgi:N-acetylneuraminic acid mutarotase
MIPYRLVYTECALQLQLLQRDSSISVFTVTSYDPKTDKWTEKTDMPTPRWGLSTCVVNNKIYAIGGNKGNAALSAVEIYDPATDKWAKETDMPTARYDLSASVVNGKIYAIGGHGVIVEEYDTGFISPRSLDPEGKLAVTWGGIKRGGQLSRSSFSIYSDIPRYGEKSMDDHESILRWEITMKKSL